MLGLPMPSSLLALAEDNRIEPTSFWVRHFPDMPRQPDDVRSPGDIVAKVENRTTPKISQKLISKADF